MQIHIHTYICLHICVYMYTNIPQDGERERSTKRFWNSPVKKYGFSALENDVNSTLGFPLEFILGIPC